MVKLPLAVLVGSLIGLRKKINESLVKSIFVLHTLTETLMEDLVFLRRCLIREVVTSHPLTAGILWRNGTPSE